MNILRIIKSCDRSPPPPHIIQPKQHLDKYMAETRTNLGGGGVTFSSYNGQGKQPIYYYNTCSGVGRCQKVGGGGGGGAHRHVIYLPSVKNQYKRVVIGYMVIY